jgi:hypothetical protein
LIEYVDKLLKLHSLHCLRQHHGKIAAEGISSLAVSFEPGNGVKTKR